MNTPGFLDVPFHLESDFIELLGSDAKHGISDTGFFFAVRDSALRTALEAYLQAGGFAGMSPREYLQGLGFKI